MKFKIPFVTSDSLTIPVDAAVLAVSHYEIAPDHVLELASTAVLEVI